MPNASDVAHQEPTERIYSLLLAGDYKTALTESESLATALETPTGEPASAEAWVAVCRARCEMGQFASAETAGLRAVSALAAAIGREHPRYAGAIAELARVYEELARWPQAETLGRQALAIRRSTLGNDHPDTARSLSDLSTVLEWLGKLDEAEACGREAAAIFARPELARDPARPQVLAYLAFAHLWHGNYTAALDAGNEAHRLAESILPAGHPVRATVAGLLGRLLQSGFRTETPERLITGALTLRRTALGDNHPYCANTLLALAAVRQNQRRTDDAERLIREAMRITEATYGADHVRAADAYERLADVLTEREQYTAAEPLYRRAIAIYERSLGDSNPITLESTHRMTGLLILTDRAEEAVALCRQVLDRSTDVHMVGLSDARQALARALGATGQMVEAREQAAIAVRMLRGVTGAAPSWLAYALGTLSWYQLATGNVAAGVASAREVFDLTAAEAGNSHLATLEAARALAAAHQQQGEAAQAENILRRAMAVAPAPTPTFDLRSDLAGALAVQQKLEDAEDLYFQIVKDRRRAGAESTALAEALVDLGAFYEGCGNLGAAEPRYQEALDIWRAIDPDGIGVARGLHTLAALRHGGGLLPAAMSGYQQALDAYRKSAGEDSTEFALCQHDLARLYLNAGKADEAEPVIRKAVETLARGGEQNASYLAARRTLAGILASKGNYHEARDTLLAVLSATRESVGHAHESTLEVQSELAGVHLDDGDLLSAEPLLREVAERHRERYPNDPRLALDESRLAQVYTRFGEYEPARRHVDRYLSLVRQGGANSPAYAFGLLLLADVHLLRDDYNSALASTKEALAIRRRAFGDSHPLVAVTFQQIALLELDLGRLKPARTNAAEATAIIRRVYGQDHPEFSIALRTEAGINSVAAPDTVGEMLRRAVELDRRCYGDNSPARIAGLIARSDWFVSQRQYVNAEQLLREAAGILRLAGSEENLVHASVASRLGVVMMRTGRTAEAGSFLRQTQGITSRVLGAEHPDAVGAARRLSWWHVSQGAVPDALATLERAIPGEDAWGDLAGDAAIPFDRYKSAVDAILTDRVRIGLLTRTADADVLPAYSRLLRNRNREAALLKGPPLGCLPRSDALTRWRRLRVQLIDATLAGPMFVKPEVHLARLNRWREEERTVAAEFPTESKAEPNDIARALPPNAALVEFVRVIEEVDQEDRSRYAAFVLRAGSSADVKLIDLGSAVEIDRRAAEWTGFLARGNHTQEAAAGQKVAELLLLPLLPHLDNVGELCIVADTALRTLPWAALPIPHERLVDRFAVTLFTTANTLLALRSLPPERAPVVVADPSEDGLFGWLRRRFTGRVRGGAAVAAKLGVSPHYATDDWSRLLCGKQVHVAVPGTLDAEPSPVAGKPTTRYIAPPTRYGVRWGSLRLTAARLCELRLVPGAVIVMPETVPAAGPVGAEAITWVARAFRHAGAGGVIFGLWANPEWAEYWRVFHDAVKAGTSPAESLRQAQLGAKEQGLTPGAWGGFVCVAG